MAISTGGLSVFISLTKVRMRSAVRVSPRHSRSLLREAHFAPIFVLGERGEQRLDLLAPISEEPGDERAALLAGPDHLLRRVVDGAREVASRGPAAVAVALQRLHDHRVEL